MKSMKRSVNKAGAKEDFARKLYDLWKKSIAAYEKENMGDLFSQAETGFLEANAMTPQDLYDYAEDFVKSGEPDFVTVLLIQEVCRDYLHEERGGVVSTKKLSADALPKRSQKKRGVVGLARVLEKARAKLHGELLSDLMYSCPSDRAFLKESNIHPAELLRAIWFYEKNTDQKDGLIKWILHRRKDRDAFCWLSF